jgi:hypothetical protein
VLPIPQLKLNLAARQNLGKQFAAQVNNVKSGRDEFMRTIWERALIHYEGKAEVRNFPWENASNAIVPMIPTHTDAIKARLYNAATGQDPMNMIETWGGGEIMPGIKGADYSRAMNKLSQWVEREEVPVEDLYEQATAVFATYGDVILFVDWVREVAGDYSYDAVAGEFKKEEDTVVRNLPVIRAIHPEDFFIDINAKGFWAIQEAPWCGYRFWLDHPTLLVWKELGLYDEETADELLGYFPDVDKDPESRQYFPGGGDGTNQMEQQLSKREDELLDLTSKSPAMLEMVHVFARVDFDNDKIPEETNFHIHLKSGNTPYVARNHWGHKRRPLVRMNYEPRTGKFNSIGVPEMLFNPAEIINQAMRDVLDNNKVQNTKCFLAKANGTIPLDLVVSPGSVIFVDDLASDFMPIDMGSGKMSTSIQDIQFLMQWGERRTGISDFNLGQERTSRTPATTTLALLEEANKRIDKVIRRMRRAQREIWYQVMSLYIQFGDPKNYRDVLGDQDTELLSKIWNTLSIDQLLKRTQFRARISTQNLNKSVRRQESMALFGSAKEYYGSVLELVQLMVTAQDPAVKELLSRMLKGGYELWQKHLDSYDIQDQENLNPDYEAIAEEANEGFPAIPETASQTGGQSDQVSAALSAVAGTAGQPGPINPPGRPEPGAARPTNELG